MVENDEGRVVDRSLMDYVLLPKRTLGRLLDVKLWRGEGGAMTDHILVDLGVQGGLYGVRNVLNVSELNNIVKEGAYQES